MLNKMLAQINMLGKALREWQDPHGKPMNHWQFQNCATAFRISILVAVFIRFKLFGVLPKAPSQIQAIAWVIVYALFFIYTVSIFGGFLLKKKNPLILLYRRFFIIQGFIDLLVFLGWILAAGITDTNITLCLLLPFLISIRLGLQTNYRILIWAFILISFPIIEYILLPNLSILTNIWLLQELSSYFDLIGKNIDWSWMRDWFITMIFILLVSHIITRNWFRNSGDFLRQNIKFSLDWLQKETNAKCIFLRLAYQHTDGKTYLFLLSTSPLDLDTATVSHFIDFEERKHIALCQVWDSEKPRLIRGAKTLQGELHDIEIISRFNLVKGYLTPLGTLNNSPHQKYLSKLFALFPFLKTRSSTLFSVSSQQVSGKSGTLSLYWSDESNIHPEKINKWATQISHYIANQFAKASQPNQTELGLLDQQLKDRFLNEGIQKMIHETDLLKTCNIICEIGAKVSGSSSAFILFYDSEKGVYSVNPQFGKYGLPKSVQLEQLEISREVIDALPLQFDPALAFENRLRFPQFCRCWCEKMRVIEGEENRQIGLLIVADITDDKDRYTLASRQRLRILADHGAVDLRNNQLLKMKDQALTTLETIVHETESLFQTTQYNTLHDLFQAIVTAVHVGLDADFCTMMLIDQETRMYDTETLATSDNDTRLKKEKINDSDPQQTLMQVLERENGLLYIDYTNEETVSDFIVQSRIQATFVVRLDLTPNEMAILFVNDLSKRLHVDTMLALLPILQGQIKQAYQSWQLRQEWQQELQRRQRERWRFDIHDQINELEFKVTKPIERLLLKSNGRLQNDEKLQLNTIYAGVRGVNQTLREVMQDMNSPILVEQGLVAALSYLSQQPTNPFKLIINQQNEGEEPPPQVINTLYRIAREALSNAFKHGRPPVVVSLHLNHKYAILTVRDHGNGLKNDNHNGTGKSLMAYQAQLINANLIFSNLKKQGTLITCTWRNVVKEKK